MFVFLVRMRDGDGMRMRIEDAARQCPGITKNALARQLGVNWNAIRHHVDIMEQHGQIGVDRRGWSHHLYVTAVPVQLRRLVSALYDADASRILDAVLATPDIGSYQLGRELSMSRKKILNHLTDLRETGLVDRVGLTRPRYRPAMLRQDLDALRLRLNGRFNPPVSDWSRQHSGAGFAGRQSSHATKPIQ